MLHSKALSEDEQSAGRLPDSHKVVKQLARANWQLTQRGFGPWARIYRPAKGSKRNCVQLCIPAWNALDAREWDRKDNPVLPTMHPADLARYLSMRVEHHHRALAEILGPAVTRKVVARLHAHIILRTGERGPSV